jgi:hypothetical protein
VAAIAAVNVTSSGVFGRPARRAREAGKPPGGTVFMD